MGLEECLDCGGTVADSVGACPHCGSKANSRKRKTEQVAAAIEATTIKNVWQFIRVPFWIVLSFFLFVVVLFALVLASQ
jgi:uncharacterized membrane protein YvbJ